MKKNGKFSVAMRLLALVKPLTGYMVLAIVLGILGHLCAAFITIFGGYALLSMLAFPAPLSLPAMFGVIGLLAALRGIFHYGEQTSNHYIAFTLLALLRDQVFRALRRLCPAKLATQDKGNLISVITSDIELLEVFYAHTVSPVAIGVLMATIMSLFIGSFHMALGVMAAAAYIAVGLVIPLVTSKRSGADGMRFRVKTGNLSSFVLDSLRGLSETLQYNTGKTRLAEMNQRTDALSQDEEKMKRRSGIGAAVTVTVILGFDLLMLLVSAALYQNGSIAFNGVLIPVIALMSSFGPVIALANLGGTLQTTLAAGARVLAILDETPAVSDIAGKREIAFQGAAAENISFSYGGDMILSAMSVNIPRHAVVGITGRSGSGKSTLLRLLMRFWAVQSGCVSISGTDIDAINTANLRDMESFVTQETHVFRDTLRNNVRIAKLEASDAEIETACKKAAIHDFIMRQPQGYDTPVGELGDTLSGGERQRIGLARAFLHNAPLLLLDEPTSNLDSLNEAVVLRSVGEERAGKTVVLVSHRQSTMRIADRVYGMANGRVS